MEWLNIHTPLLDSENFLGAEPVDRATWLCLLRYCAGQENSGRIIGCAAWADRKWQQLARVTLAEVDRECGLWSWDHTTLIVWGYPLEHEERAKRLRGQSGKANAIRWGKNGHAPKARKPRPAVTLCKTCGGRDSECPLCADRP